MIIRMIAAIMQKTPAANRTQSESFFLRPILSFGRIDNGIMRTAIVSAK